LRPDRSGKFLLGLAELVGEVAQAGEELGGEFGTGQRDGTGRAGPFQDPGSLSRVDLFRVTAWDQVAEHRMKPACDLATVAGQVTVTLGPDLQHRR
jgi:hypothetical protein